MRCRKCGEYLQPESAFCTRCGHKIETYYDDGWDDGAPPRPPQNRNTFMYVILAVVLALVIAAAYLVYIKPNPDSKSDPTPTPEPTVTATPEPTAAPTATQIIVPTPVPVPASDSYYLLPESSTRRMTDADLSRLTHEQLCFARNEIFARYGRKFDTPQVARYFESQPWYHGTIPAASFNENMLNSVEKANVGIITEYERVHYGGSYY